MTVILSGILSAMPWGLAEADTYRESPMLAMRVAAGELPPIGERLPRDPMVVHPYERIGAYGGQMRVVTGKVNALNETQFMLYTPLLRFASDGRTIVPNVARHWEASDDATSFTFYLRKGMRWSDGVPVTSEDVRFAWEDVLLHKAITPVLPNFMPRLRPAPRTVIGHDSCASKPGWPPPRPATPRWPSRSCRASRPARSTTWNGPDTNWRAAK